MKSIAPQVLADIAWMEKDERLTRYIDFAGMRRLLHAIGRHQKSGNQAPVAQALRVYLLARYIEWFERRNS